MMPLELPLPPTSLRFMRENDARFLAIGDNVVANLVMFCGMKDGSRVLDVGSGYGRVAHALRRSGQNVIYHGFDILPRHIAWCQNNLTQGTDGRFTFAHLDVLNARYNPNGKIAATEVTFGVKNASVDVAVLTSVFTHMYATEIERYLAELGRVLRRGGRALTTWFALDETWAAAERDGRGQYPMSHAIDDTCRFHNPDDPLHAIGFTPAWIRTAVDRAGMRVFVSRLGTWCGRDAGMGLQDVFVLQRK